MEAGAFRHVCSFLAIAGAALLVFLAGLSVGFAFLGEPNRRAEVAGAVQAEHFRPGQAARMRLGVRWFNR